MKIDLTIGELTLGGVAHSQRHHVAAAVVRELERLLAERGVPAAWQAAGRSTTAGSTTTAAGTTGPEVAAGPLAASLARQRPNAAPRELGAGIGRAVYATNPNQRG